MCKCTPEIRAPFCGKPGCEWPKTPRVAPTYDGSVCIIRMQSGAITVRFSIERDIVIATDRFPDTSFGVANRAINEFMAVLGLPELRDDVRKRYERMCLIEKFTRFVYTYPEDCKFSNTHIECIRFEQYTHNHTDEEIERWLCSRLGPKVYKKFEEFV
jgi:hypothetical protein